MNNQIIKSISIKNFRSYKDTFVKFHPGINAIIGENDAGKSNIRRALDWVINNNPAGDDIFPLYWEGNPEVEIDIGNKLVTRFRSKSENLYTLTHADGDKEVFKSFGRGVPQIIKDHLNISFLNMSSQWDTFFLLDKSAADVAKHYNELVNLTVIDKAISNIASTLRKEKGTLKIEQELQTKKTEELKEFDWLPEADKELIALEKLNNYLKKLNSDWSDLSGLIKRLEELEKSNQKLFEITKYEVHVNILLNKKEKINGIKKDHDELQILITNIRSLANEDKKLNNIIQYQNEINSLIEKSNQINEIIETENELTGYIDQLKHYQEAEKRYKNIVKYTDKTKALLVLDREIEKDIYRYNSLQESLEKRLKLDQEHENLKNKLNKLEKEFVKLMPKGPCPLCGK